MGRESAAELKAMFSTMSDNYEAMMEMMDDDELTQLIEARRDEFSEAIDVALDDL